MSTKDCDGSSRYDLELRRPLSMLYHSSMPV